MKPVSLRFQCFGPYMAEQYIDFSELEKSGLFLICGETGAGKTTILDAMCYALYGRSSGGLRGDMEVMRCKLAKKEDETLVEFVFDSGGQRYQFTRSLKYGRKHLNDTHNCLVLQDGEFVPIFENPKATFVNQKAQELIGLTYDQFRQVIILPQGQFEKLLVSDSAEKEKILVSLFHADRWQKIAEELYRRVFERDGRLKQEKLQITARLREYGCEDLGQLEEQISRLTGELEQLRKEAAEAEAAATLCRRRSDEAILRNQAFLELSSREKQLESLRCQEPAFEAEARLLQAADIAERIRPQNLACQEARARKLRAEGMAAQCETALDKAQKTLAAAQEARQRHEQARERNDQNRQQILLLENARELYRSLSQKQSAAAQKSRELASAEEAMEQAKRRFLLRDWAWQQAMAAQNDAMDAYREAQRVYLQGIGSTLAQRLTAGEPCPVCGSREHPAPAQPALGHITEAQLEERNRAVSIAGEAVSSAMHQRTQAENIRNQAVTAWNQAAQAAAVAKSDYENDLVRRIPGIETEAQLERGIQTLRSRVTAYGQAEERITKALSEAVSGESMARARLETACEELSAAQTAYAAADARWQTALAESGLGTAERFREADLEPREKQCRRENMLRFRADLAQAEKSLQAQRQQLEGQAPPDMAAIKKELEQTQARSKALSGHLVLTENSLKKMASDAASLRRRSENYDRERQIVDGDLDFANRLRGRSGVSLQRYVLGVMLTSITAAANHLLRHVYGGRYRLYRTDEIAGSGRKGGLELEVYDSHNDQRRSVTTLSGGEKFLVALSLAIGLSSVVQAQGGGIRLEAMFIDEGFGSLDREAVNDALEVLQGIQRSSGIVGIISHVEQLTETIPTRLEITKGKNGSTCRLRNG